MKLLFICILIISTYMGFTQTKYIAHRGASNLAPENTVSSAKLGWELGADAVEVDVHLSKDNRIMVIHDKTTKRTCMGKNFTIKTSPSYILRDLDAGSFNDEKFKGEKIPFISEIIELIPENKNLVIELKSGSDVIPYLKRDLEKNEKLSQLLFIGFDWETIVEAKKVFPENKCYWLSAIKSGLKKKMQEASDAGLDGVNLKYSLIDKKIMDLANELGLEVLTWTVDEPAEANRLIGLGVTQITTNRPKWLKEEVVKL